ncbi:hypothetical protein BC826DRAFT_1113657 [Russula brevipes]|nr:hypothetical protein BC826DRAFT_1113657 [Russula brevipes]
MLNIQCSTFNIQPRPPAATPAACRILFIADALPGCPRPALPRPVALFTNTKAPRIISNNSNRFYIVLATWTPMHLPGQLRMLAFGLCPPRAKTTSAHAALASSSSSHAMPHSDTPLVSRAPTPAPEKDEDDPKPSVPPHRSDPSTTRAARPPTSGGGGGGDGDDFGVWATNTPPPLRPPEKDEDDHTDLTPRPRAPPIHL